MFQTIYQFQSNLYFKLSIEDINENFKLQEILNITINNYSCKICFGRDSDLNNPLLTPCKCSGSMSYIHYKCLKECVNVKTSKKEFETYIFFNWKNFECEICLTEYPKIIKYKNNIYNLLDLVIPYDQYLLIDYIVYDDEKKKSFRKGYIALKVVEDEVITFVFKL